MKHKWEEMTLKNESIQQQNESLHATTNWYTADNDSAFRQRTNVCLFSLVIIN